MGSDIDVIDATESKITKMADDERSKLDSTRKERLLSWVEGIDETRKTDEMTVKHLSQMAPSASSAPEVSKSVSSKKSV